MPRSSFAFAWAATASVGQLVEGLPDRLSIGRREDLRLKLGRQLQGAAQPAIAAAWVEGDSLGAAVEPGAAIPTHLALRGLRRGVSGWELRRVRGPVQHAQLIGGEVTLLDAEPATRSFQRRIASLTFVRRFESPKSARS